MYFTYEKEINCTSVNQEGILSLKLKGKRLKINQQTLLILQWRRFKIEIKTYSDPVRHCSLTLPLDIVFSLKNNIHKHIE